MPAAPATDHCWECLKRRLVCDQARPGCRKCHAKGIDCPGYDQKPLRWMQPGQTRSKGARSKTRLRAEPSSVARHRATPVRGNAAPQAESDNAAKSANGGSTSETFELIVSPSLKDKSITTLLLQGIEYYNTKILPDLVCTGMGGIGNPFYISPEYASSIPPAISETIICFALGHRILQTVPGLREERDALARNLQSHRGEAIRCLAKDLPNSCNDVTLVATLSLLLSEIQHSISPNWWQHAEGAYAMIDVRGGIADFGYWWPKSRPLLRLFALVDIFASTTSPCVYPHQARRQFQMLGHLGPLMEDGLSTCTPCPIELLIEVIRINHDRSLNHTQLSLTCNNAENSITSERTSLDSIMAFCPITWASRVSMQISQGTIVSEETTVASSPATWDWIRVARVYQSAVALYCLSTTAKPLRSNLSDEGDVIFLQYRSSLLKDLQTISADKHSHLRKLVLWPLAILGLTLDLNDKQARKYVISELKWSSAAVGSASPLVAKDLLEKIWLRGAGGRGGREGRAGRWEELFDRPYVFGL